MKNSHKFLRLLLCIVLLINLFPLSALAADRTCPLINPISSSAGTTFTKGTSTTFSTKASDNVALKRIRLYIDGTCMRTVTKTTTVNTISYTANSLSAGTHTVKVIAYDTSGNTNETSITVTVTNKAKDTTPPLINPIASSAGTTFTKGTSTTFSTKASDNVALKSIKLYIDGTCKKTSSTSTISCTISSLSVGSHTIKVIAYDTSGNTNQTSITVKVTNRDTTLPVINPITSSAGTTFAKGTSTTFSTRASDNVELYAVKLYIDGSRKKTVYTDTISYTTDSLSVGSHTIKVTAVDTSDNYNETTITVKVTDKAKDTT